MKDVVWRVTVARIQRNRVLDYEVFGAVTNENGCVHDASIVLRWKFTGTSFKAKDTLRWAGGMSGPGEVLFPHDAEQFSIPKYVIASIQALARTMIASEKKSVQLPIDFFDPSGPSRQKDEVRCEPEG